jgi:hypothetical protein
MEVHLVLATLAQRVTFEPVWSQHVATGTAISADPCAAGSVAPTGDAAAQKLMADGWWLHISGRPAY